MSRLLNRFLGAGGIVGVLRFAGEVTRAAVDGTSLRGIKRYGSLLSTLRALDRNLDALADSRGLRCGDRSQPFILRLFAGLAAFGLVLQPLVVKKRLLAGCPDEFLVTVYTQDCAIGMLDLGAWCRLKDSFPF